VTRKRAVLVVVLLVALSVAMVAVAAATESYVPLFLIWAIQAPIPWVAAKTSKGHPAN
jgi:hypothetical protein